MVAAGILEGLGMTTGDVVRSLIAFVCQYGALPGDLLSKPNLITRTAVAEVRAGKVRTINLDDL